ncbi:hypothetical protein MKEN_00475900 [Mycena kentingensis (nom. inval.)]|nr:hypothetical protein MKEN_00475900 [Mycena kentingensis (nom. inval.)]
MSNYPYAYSRSNTPGPPLPRSSTPGPGFRSLTPAPAPTPRASTPGSWMHDAESSTSHLQYAPSSLPEFVVPPGTCPSCGNPGNDKWRFGKVSAAMICDPCAKYEERKGIRRPPRLEVRRHQRGLSDGLGVGWEGGKRIPKKPAAPPEPERYSPDDVRFRHIPGYSAPQEPHGRVAGFVDWSREHPEYKPSASASSGAYVPYTSQPYTARPNRAPANVDADGWVISTPGAGGPAPRAPSAPPPAQVVDCPNCHSALAQKWKYGPVSQAMVCNPCGQYEVRYGRKRDVGLEVRRTLRRFAGGLR